MAGKIETTVLKPTKSDFQGGFKAENVLRHDLGGSVRDTIEKSTSKLKVLRDQAKALRAGSVEAIDLSQIVKETAADVLKNRVGSFGVNKKMETALDGFVKEMEYISPNGKITVPQAQEVKEALGTFGSWLFGSRDLDATAQERVANIMYSRVKAAIEKNSPKELADVNKAMSEIIPIKNAAIRRLPIEERNNAIGLGDIISAGVALQNPTGWGLLLVNQLQKSGRFAGSLYRGAEKLRIGTEALQKKLPKLRITPQTLLDRNATLRTAGKNVLQGTIKAITKKKVNKSAVLYHGSDAAAIIREKGFKLGESSNRSVGAASNVDRLGRGIYFSDNPKDAAKYARSWSEQDVVKSFAKPGTKIKEFKNYQSWYDFVKKEDPKAFSNPELLNKIFKDKGFDGVTLAGDTVIFDTKNILTEKQAPALINQKLRTSTGAAELNFKRADNLTARDRLTESRAIKKLVNNKEKLVNEYIAKNKKIANTDEARKLFASAGYKGYNSAAVQEPASELNKEVFRTMLKNNPEPYVTIYAGGSGSGKSTAVGNQKRIKNIMDKSAAILDGNLSSYKSAIARVEEAINAGKRPKFVYVYREPVDAFENGVVARMHRNVGEGGRIVPVKVTAGNHKDSLEVIKRLYQEAPEKYKKDFKFIDNSLGKGKSKLMTYDQLLKKSMPADLEKQLANKTKELYDQGKITKLQYKKYLE